ncbi:DUF1501 domain-containing protein [Photobacterium sanctipauli]|uniref:DUF1501 domain-containing protein n=1 Tax=Photobacterium sanctipauli TaxID=1342794 RepID=A0A2T3P010_9GAMM|nr:DUF1501 domain-containing protein [Photobacterium sanctipauli]PSW21864.1 DUF1501 domain-containing protein [Photobacterium sanctipauli]
MMKLSRRRFLQHSALMTGASSLPMAFTLSNKAYAATDYKAMVCVFLRGGNDSFNMLMAGDDDLYGKYATRRPNIAIEKTSLLMTGKTDNNGVPIGLHPNMPGVQSLFQNGLAAGLINIGTLVGPAGSGAPNPTGLFNHSKQQYAWESAWQSSGYAAYGWGGLLMDLLAQGGAIPELVSLGGNSWLSGVNVGDVRTNTQGSVSEVSTFSDSSTLEAEYNEMVNEVYLSPFHQQYLKQHEGFLTPYNNFRSLIESTPLDPNISRNSSLSSQLSAVKRIIDASVASGSVGRQVFIVNQGGYDTHSNQLPRHESLYSQLDTALTEFTLALESLQPNVTTFTMSDFGRTMHNNSNNGTDHGWGSNQLVIGGSVMGGCYGAYPDFSVGSPDDNGRGRLIPTLAHEQMAATLATWFGVSSSGIETVFPTTSANFGTMNLGFMG